MITRYYYVVGVRLLISAMFCTALSRVFFFFGNFHRVKVVIIFVVHADFCFDFRTVSCRLGFFRNAHYTRPSSPQNRILEGNGDLSSLLLSDAKQRAFKAQLSNSPEAVGFSGPVKVYYPARDL